MLDLNNLLTIAFQQSVLLALPLSILAYGIFLAVRLIPSRIVQCLVPLVAGTILIIVYTSQDPSNPGESASLLFATGVLIHPFLVLPPILFIQKYLHHFLTFCAVFSTIFLSLCFVITWGILLGDMTYGGDTVWQSIILAIGNLLAASIVSGLVLILDRFLLPTEKKNFQ
jgi:hypothetical protein